MVLRSYVEKQMRPGDAAAIMRTNLGNAALQTLSSDKRYLLAMIDNVLWSGKSGTMFCSNLNEASIQKEAMAYCIKALQDMPGRKFLLLLTPAMVAAQSDPAAAQLQITAAMQKGYEANRNKDSVGMQAAAATIAEVSGRNAYDRLADSALRAGVVVHTLPLPADVSSSLVDAARNRSWDEPSMMTSNQKAAQQFLMRKSPPFDLSRPTGGASPTGQNWFLNGIADLEEQMKGYYLITYVPPPSTFSRRGSNEYHRITIKTNRPKSEVYTRAGFYGRTEPPTEPAKTDVSLTNAMFSPFQYKDLKVNLAAGYLEDLPKGYMLRAWLHLDGQALGIMSEKDGGKSIWLETSAATTNINGFMEDLGKEQLRFQVNDEEIQWVWEHGFRFALSLPTKKPGTYYVRVAARDQASGAIGSAYQFIEIPDLKNNSLALSSIFIINRAEDASWIQPATTKESLKTFFPSEIPANRSQALRSYKPGEGFEYMAVVYNAKTRGKKPPDIEYQTVLFGNGKELYRGNSEAVDLSGINDYKRIPIRNKLLLASTLQPGDYALQLEVRDKQAEGKSSIAIQIMSFEILAADR